MVVQLHITFLLGIFLVLFVVDGGCVCVCMHLIFVIFQKIFPILLVSFSEHLVKSF